MASASHSLYRDALQQYQSGQLEAAERLLQQALVIEAHHADSLHLSGLIAFRRRRIDQALELVCKAIAHDPAVPAYHSNYGNMLRDQGRLDEAIACQRRALALKPDFVEAQFNLGLALAQRGQLEEALGCFSTVLQQRPDFPSAAYHLGHVLIRCGRIEEATSYYRAAVTTDPHSPWPHYGLGGALAQQGKLEEAITSLQQAVLLKPDFLEARNNLANLLKHQGKLHDAVTEYRSILAIQPNFVEVANNLGIALGDLGRLDEAITCYRQTIAAQPDFPGTYNNLGNALERRGERAEAEYCFRKAISLRPDFAKAHFNLGNILRDRQHLDEAVASYRAALAQQPAYPEAWNNLGNTLRDTGRPLEAVAALRQAITLKPDFADAHGNLGLALLATGDFTAGWEEYEWRWKTPAMGGAGRGFTQPLWRGESAGGKTLLIHAEQGMGDTIQFCRYALMAVERGLRVVMEVQPPLRRLLRQLPGLAHVVARGETLPDFDLHCPMLSLPRAFGTTQDTIPAMPAYLSPSHTVKTEAWRTRLGSSRLLVGLVWAGSSLLPSDAQRSLRPDRLAPLFDVDGIRFISLQKSGPPPPAALAMDDFMADMQDFADTAALTAALDLIVSVDTAMLHLAAALGRPTWLLDRFAPDWRWLTADRTSSWYPSLRIYRQPRPGDWDSVLQEVAHDLRRL